MVMYLVVSLNKHGKNPIIQKLIKFIFSLINKDDKPKKIKWSKNPGNSSHGPIFVEGHNLNKHTVLLTK